VSARTAAAWTPSPCGAARRQTRTARAGVTGGRSSIDAGLEGRAALERQSPQVTVCPPEHPVNIVVTGSIAFDYLMSFPGKFTEHCCRSTCTA
jgi:hypothetical protein